VLVTVLPRDGTLGKRAIGSSSRASSAQLSGAGRRGFLSCGNAGIRSRNFVLANEHRDTLETRSTAASCPRQLPARRAKRKEISGRGKGNESSQRAEGNARES